MSQSVLTIREAALADSASIAGVIRAQGLFAQMSDEAYAQAHVAPLLKEARRERSNTVPIVEQSNGAIVGYIAVHWFPNLLIGNMGYVPELFIHSTATGQGIGERLVDHVKGLAIERCCVCLTLINLCNREPYPRSFYTKQGWRERQEAANFIFDLPAYHGSSIK